MSWIFDFPETEINHCVVFLQNKFDWEVYSGHCLRLIPGGNKAVSSCQLIHPEEFSLIAKQLSCQGELKVVSHLY